MVFIHELEEIFIKGGYYVEMSGYYGNKVIWGVLDDNVVEEGKEHDEIGLRGFDFNFMMKIRRGWLEKYLVSILIYQC